MEEEQRALLAVYRWCAVTVWAGERRWNFRTFSKNLECSRFLSNNLTPLAKYPGSSCSEILNNFHHPYLPTEKISRYFISQSVSIRFVQFFFPSLGLIVSTLCMYFEYFHFMSFQCSRRFKCVFQFTVYISAPPAHIYNVKHSKISIR